MRNKDLFIEEQEREYFDNQEQGAYAALEYMELPVRRVPELQPDHIVQINNHLS